MSRPQPAHWHLFTPFLEKLVGFEGLPKVVWFQISTIKEELLLKHPVDIVWFGLLASNFRILRVILKQKNGEWQFKQNKLVFFGVLWNWEFWPVWKLSNKKTCCNGRYAKKTILGVPSRNSMPNKQGLLAKKKGTKKISNQIRFVYTSSWEKDHLLT